MPWFVHVQHVLSIALVTAISKGGMQQQAAALHCNAAAKLSS
jgi:hypothetical protein